MKTTLIIAATVSLLFAAPAFADCAADMAKIDETMKTIKLDEANSTKAKELMDKAKAAQAASDETGCAASSKEILTMLGM